MPLLRRAGNLLAPPVVIAGAARSIVASRPAAAGGHGHAGAAALAPDTSKRPATAKTPTAAPTKTGPAMSSAAHRPEYARITAAHRARLDGGELLAQSSRLDWAKLLRRTFACDVLVCPQCTGRARVLAAIHDPAEARRFLDALHQRSIARRLPQARPSDADEEPQLIDLGDDTESESPPPSSRPEAPPPDD